MKYIHESIIPNTYLPIKVFSFSAKSADRIIVDHWHKSAELLFCVEGQLFVWLSGKKIILNPGDAVFINSNMIHSSQSPDKNIIIVLQAPLPFMESISNGKYHEEVIIEINKNLSNGEIEAILEKILDESSDDWVRSIEHLSSIYYLFFLLFRDFSVTTNKENLILTERYLDRLAKITSYIKEVHTGECNLTQVADEFGFNPSYMARFFKKYMGMTFKEYLNMLRLNSAYKLLMRTDKTIEEIALESGFSNSKSFSSSFKKMYELTPFHYKKSINDLK